MPANATPVGWNRMSAVRFSVSFASLVQSVSKEARGKRKEVRKIEESYDGEKISPITLCVGTPTSISCKIPENVNVMICATGGGTPRPTMGE